MPLSLGGKNNVVRHSKNNWAGTDGNIPLSPPFLLLCDNKKIVGAQFTAPDNMDYGINVYNVKKVCHELCLL